MPNKSISLIFPMYNEIAYLPRAVNKAEAVLREITSDYEIIVVDDASTDGSGEMLRAMSEENRRIKPLRHQKNRKLGGAMKTGFYNARGEIIIYSDIDLPFELGELKRFIPLLDKADIVVGKRRGHRSSFMRILYSRVYNNIIRKVFAINIRDINFSMKIFKKDVLDFIELHSEGSFINAEFLIKAVRLGYRIKEVDVDFTPRQYGVSRLSSLSVVLKIIYEMIKHLPELQTLSKNKILYKKTKQLYSGSGLKVSLHNMIRYKTCPFNEIRKLLPEKGRFLDFGCGYGFFSNLVHIENKNRQVLGVDIDERKINVALATREPGANINFKKVNSTYFDSLPPSIFDCIILLDVLYLLPYSEQERVLARSFVNLSAGGILILKETVKSPLFKFIIALIQEIVSVKITKTTKGDRLYFRTEESYLKLLQDTGFNVKILHLDKGYLYPHTVFLARKIA